MTALALRAVIALLGATCRVRFGEGEGRLEELAASGRPVIFAFWHNRVLFLAHTLRRRLLRRGYPIAVLVSHSGDGALGAALARMWGARVVRGSTSRGGSAGLRGMYRAVRDGSAAVTIPDGPRGPIYRCQPGVVALAQMSRTPIVPLAFAAERCWRVRSWDRLIVPKPFTRVHLAVGEALDVGRELSADALAGEQLRVESALNQLVERVETAAGEPARQRDRIE